MRRAMPPTVKPGSFAAVIRAFLVSPKYLALALSTRVSYAYLLRLAEQPETLGAIPAETALKSVEKWALVRDLLVHPITTGTEAAGSVGGHVPWTDAQVKHAETHARPHIARVITLAANLGQRGSDLVRMRWTDIEVVQGRPGINVTTMKTGRDLWIPFSAEMQAEIDKWEKRPGFIALKEDGQPWTRPQLSNQWDRERETNEALAPLKAAGLRMHGLRGTAVLRLRRAGVAKPLICDMIGMSPMMVDRYCRLSEQRQNALAAVAQMEGARGTGQDKNTGADVVPFSRGIKP
jgi:integrase